MRIFTVYTKDGCVWCTRVKNLLTSLGHTYVERNVDKDEDALDTAITLQFKTMPQVFENLHDELQHIGGFEATEAHLKGVQ